MTKFNQRPADSEVEVPEVTFFWHGISCCEFVVDAVLEPALFRRLGLAGERIRKSSIADGAINSYQSLGLYWNRPQFDREELVESILSILDECLSIDDAACGATVHKHVVEVDYQGPDLASVSDHCGLSPAEVIRRHVDGNYAVAAIGFMPNFAYLWGMDAGIATPRKASPRPRVPVGSLGIANDQTGIYPCESPGGWQLIGQVADRDCRKTCAQMRVGDVVQFVDSSGRSTC
ncbi:5-oxoprolinase subunit B family protein [Planctomycetes bacterium K23_9]|uniref:Kinase A inhibitor n=1 Tax=Stieleria marina TaxID=1930275 RepID=A0A517NRT2_9BACT|nr:Kinase A inhibitor [Planctomycetes bacterium K23_9]